MDGAIVDTDLIGRLLDGPRAVPIQDVTRRKIPDAARLGRRMTVLYASWQHGRPPDLAALAAGLLHRNAIAADGPVGRTCLGAAHAVAAWGGLPYHSATHHAEVAVNAMVMVELQARMGRPIGAHETSLLLAACLSHDLYYQPSVARERFAAERVAADALDAIATEAGAGAADRAAMRALVVATEPRLRLRAGGPLGAPLAPKAAKLLGTGTRRTGMKGAVDPVLASLAAILSDADLLSSVGLTTEWYRVQETRLAQEAGRPAPPGESGRFFRDIVGPDFLSAPGRAFSANLAAIRQAVCAPA